MNQIKTYDILALDVSKNSLQLHCSRKKAKLPNSPEGFRQIAIVAKSMQDALVVCEPTGGYERPLLEAMQRKGIATRLADASQARSFALSQGRRAKSDPIDAAMIHAFATQRRLQPARPLGKAQRLVADLLDRRTQLADHAASEKARLDKTPKAIAKSIERMIRLIEREVASIEARIAKAVARDARCSRMFEAFVQVSGVGKVTAWSVIAYLPEIGTIDRGRLASLVGVAPHPADSGNRTGKRSISGGKAKMRKPLYMAAAIARIHNEHLKAFYERLSEKGKPYKVCIVAVMRKLIIHLQSIARKVELELV